MKDVIYMWKYTKMVVLVALTAAVYAGTANRGGSTSAQERSHRG